MAVANFCNSAKIKIFNFFPTRPDCKNSLSEIAAFNRLKGVRGLEGEEKDRISIRTFGNWLGTIKVDTIS